MTDVKNLSSEPILVVAGKAHQLRHCPNELMQSMPAKYKGWSCKLYVIWMHCQN